MANEDTESSLPNVEGQRSLLDIAQTVLPPAAIVATPFVAKWVNRPPKEEPPKLERPPGYQSD